GADPGADLLRGEFLLQLLEAGLPKFVHRGHFAKPRFYPLRSQVIHSVGGRPAACVDKSDRIIESERFFWILNDTKNLGERSLAGRRGKPSF
ncbi:hypothetical protein, partial [Paracoccus sp. (in: a-proteobacteria)]|uniref:hypothetical protein n=1 Tax=Paracoccus sp. TaxID=267 RepID=UPI002D7E7074